MRHFLVLLALLIVTAPVAAADAFFLKDGQRVVFLGDSNTYAGGFIASLDAYLFTRFPGQKFDLINLGLPSETCSGLSEPDHPYPRPDVHERLERALAKTKPDIVVACYGMNDGIYSPFAAERLKKYQEGMLRLIERCENAGAKVVLMTPTPFDPLPVKAKLLPKTAEKFSWLKPYEDYDSVLGRYSEWLLTLRTKGYIVIDAHTALNKHVRLKRADDAKYTLSGDGIHPNAVGHRLVAEEILKAWHAPEEVEVASIDVKTATARRGRVSDLTVKRDTTRFTWETKLPLPAEFAGGLNRHRLVVTGAAADRYVLYEGDTLVASFTPKQLAAGIDLTTLKDLSTNRRAAEVMKLAEERQRLLGLAWLTDVGHKRPDTPRVNNDWSKRPTMAVMACD